MPKSSKSVQAPAQSTTVQATPGPNDQYDIRAAMASYRSDEVQAFATKIEKAFDERKRFEMSRVANGNADLSIVKKLNKAQGKLVIPNIVRAMMALDVDPVFINHSFSKNGDGNRFNIYAIDKAVDILRAIADGSAVHNKVNLTSLKAMLKSSAGLSRSIAKAVLSKQIRSQDQFVKDFAAERHVLSPSTTDTQVASTMRILQALGLVENTGAGREAIYKFRDTPQAKAFTELLAAA